MKFYKWYKQRNNLFAPAIKMLSKGLALKLDTYSSCTNFCRYCYAEELRSSTLGRTGIISNKQIARLVNIKSLIKNFEDAYRNDDRRTPFMNWAIRNKCYIELGTMGETFQDADLEFGVTYNFLALAKAYKMPLFINTKMNLICTNEKYRNLLINYPAPILICVTLTTEDDKLGKLYEPLAPLPSERLRVIKELNSYEHINSYVYMSPFIPSVTNRDIPAFVSKVIDAGIVGAYVRDFYMQGKTFQSAFWQKYIKNNKQYLKPFPGGYHVSYEAKREFYFQYQELASKYDKDFKVLGMKSKWFELNPYHGRVNFDRLPEQFKDGVLDFTAIPIMRKIRDNIDKPQLLLWSELGYKENQIRLPERIETNEGGINTLMEGGCNCNTSDVHYEMTGYDWLVGGMWDGWKDKPTGMFSNLDYIYPVTDKSKYYKENDNFVYAYIPDEYRGLLETEGQTFLFEAPKQKGLTIDIKNTKDFLIPKRTGGIGDKWLS